MGTALQENGENPHRHWDSAQIGAIWGKRDQAVSTGAENAAK